MGFLTDLVGSIRRDLDERPLDVERLRADAAAQPPPRPFAEVLRRSGGPVVIAELKRASPSAGPIDVQADPAATARAYEQGGAAAISVLTEARHFGGALADLTLVRSTVGIPVLRKDFLIEVGQVLQARSAGADSVLLIASCLVGDALSAMLGAARSVGMEPLVETHSDGDLRRALETDARVIGVNARDLETLQVDVAAALERLARVPEDRVAVLESGIGSRADVAAAGHAGASAVLVGEMLMRASDPAGMIEELIGGAEDPAGGGGRRPRERGDAP